jgi:hypothetical protein
MGERHQLILDYRDGRIQARCSCGAWQRASVPIRLQRLRDVHDHIQDEHGSHVAEAESAELVPA